MRTYKEFISAVEQWSGQANVRYGSVPAVATDTSVSKAVDKAIAKPGTSQSASEIKGKTGVTGSGSISYSATVGKSNTNKPEPEKASPQSRTQAQARTSTPVRGPMKPQPTQISTPVPRERAAAFMNKQQQNAAARGPITR